MTDADREQRLEQLIADYLVAQDAGISTDRAALVAANPQLDADLRSFFREHDRLARLAAPLRAAAGATTSRELETTLCAIGSLSSPSDATIDQGRTHGPIDHDANIAASAVPQSSSRSRNVRYFGDYEIQKELGHGGMGVVYKATQVSLNRPVALKMLRAGMLADDAELRRFQNEAEAVALLDHPCIVSVYEVGEHDGQRYFSMKLVEGGNLAEKLGTFKNDHRAAVNMVIEAAEAVQHAHMRGILHRDLKPANILIDDQAHPHITDFGLAKLMESDVELTTTGAVMGTPAYMSPEQAAGRRGAMTLATDVYGLGAIFYAMLTGNAPFGGESVVDTLDAVRTRPPEGPRKRNAAIPRDLELVCLKCLEKAPADRYPTAGALADDLRRWAAGEPVSVRAAGVVERVAKWARRKPTLAAAYSLGLLTILLSGLGGAAVWQWRAAEQARRVAVISEQVAHKSEGEAKLARAAAVNSEKAAHVARTQAEHYAQIAGLQSTLALNNAQSLITLVNEKLQGPDVLEIREEVLRTALRNVNHVADSFDRSTSKELITAAGLVALGGIYRQLGQSEKASRQFLRAVEIAKERVKVKRGNDAARRNLAVVYGMLGVTDDEMNRDLNSALDYQLKALALFEDIDQNPMTADSPMPRPVIRHDLSDAYRNVGLLYFRLGKLNDALLYERKAYDLAKELAEAQPNDSSLQISLTKAALALGSTAFHAGDRTQADAVLADARQRAQKLLATRPSDLAAKLNLGVALYRTGEKSLFGGSLPDARNDMQRCLKLLDEIARADPRNVSSQQNLSKAHYRLGNLDLLEMKPDDARAHFDAALRIRAAQSDVNKEMIARQLELILAQAQVGLVDAAVATAARLAAHPKVDPELHIHLARCYAIASRTLPDRELERAQTLQAKAMDALGAAVKDGYRDLGCLEGEPDLAPLRDRDDFKALLAAMPPSAQSGRDASKSGANRRKRVLVPGHGMSHIRRQSPWSAEARQLSSRDHEHVTITLADFLGGSVARI
jgi:tetratricopeptide (TPR) repeat protein/tRNA A-37 threonylcarbamoyl transferase component Bud32